MAHREECIYCRADVEVRSDVPAIGDHISWAALAESHKPNCEWILTRAHRIEPSDRLRAYADEQSDE